MNIRHYIYFLIFLSITLIFVACSSGGGSSSSIDNSSNWGELIWDQDNWA